MVFANLEKSLDYIKEEGLQEGLKKGRMESLETIALEMLRDKVHPNTIVKYTKLPLEKINDLMKKYSKKI